MITQEHYLMETDYIIYKLKRLKDGESHSLSSVANIFANLNKNI